MESAESLLNFPERRPLARGANAYQTRGAKVTAVIAMALCWPLVIIGGLVISFVKIANALIAHDLKIMNIRPRMIEGTRYVLKYGTGVDFTPWKKNIRRRLVPRLSISDDVEFDGDIPIFSRIC